MNVRYASGCGIYNQPSWDRTIERMGPRRKVHSGEIKVNSLERALEQQRRGYIVTPTLRSRQPGCFQSRAIKEFERHSRLACERGRFMAGWSACAGSA
jgi:hypothetical protein